MATLKQRIAIGLLAVSPLGLVFISDQEGSGPRVVTPAGEVLAKSYADPGVGWSLPTICRGHTKGVFRGQLASLAQCEQWLIEDATESGKAIRWCTPVAMTQGQYDALISFVHNVGAAKFCKSTLAKRINAGDCRGASAQFSRWIYAGDRPLRGLIRRRADERAMFEGGCDAWD